MYKSFHIIFLLFCVASSFAQRISPLFDLISSNSLINRTKVFREMQLNIDKELVGIQPGLRMDSLSGRITSIHKKLSDKLDLPTIDTSKGIMTLRFKKLTDIPSLSIYRQDPQLDQKVDEYLTAEYFTSIYKSYLVVVFSPLKDSTTKDALLNLIIDEIERVSSFSGDCQAELVRRILADESVHIAKIRDEIKDTLSKSGDIQKEFESMSTDVAAKLSNTIDLVGHEFSGMIDEFSQQLVSMGVGVAASNGEGAYSGGVYYSFMFNQNVQAGIYINGEATSTDSSSKQPTQSLIGGRFRYAWDVEQLDLFLAWNFGDNNFKGFETGQVGIGYSHAGDDMIIGLAGFYLYTQERPLKIADEENVYSLGLTVKGKSSTAPTFMIGYVHQGGKNSPSIRFTYPLKGIKIGG